jgi:hypothetical protein
LFVADGLSRILQHDVEKGVLHELKICRNAPGISHLLFADDALLFLEATEEQANRVHDALRIYERSTGQLINPTKWSMMFGLDCALDAQESVKGILNMVNTTAEERYLGLPTPEGPMNKDKFVTMKERLIKRLTN